MADVLTTVKGLLDAGVTETEIQAAVMSVKKQSTADRYLSLVPAVNDADGVVRFLSDPALDYDACKSLMPVVLSNIQAKIRLLPSLLILAKYGYDRAKAELVR